MKITVLGCGTSSGVPLPGCKCAVCTSNDPRNQRLRCSLFIELKSSMDPHKSSENQAALPEKFKPGEKDNDKTDKFNLLIDTSLDFRYQALRAGIEKIDAVFITHAHADHIFGLDDLRSYNFVQKTPIPIYTNSQTAQELKRVFNYVFEKDPNYQGGGTPDLTLNLIKPYENVLLREFSLECLVHLHGRMEVLGFRIGDFAYITDCSEIPKETLGRLQGLKCLILDGLRYRPHPTHFNFEQAIEVIEKLKPTNTFLTHIGHEIDFETANKDIQTMTTQSVSLAYDGLEVEV